MTTFINSEDLPIIEKLSASSLSETLRKRVRLLLLYEAGMKTGEIAEKVDLSPGRVLYWRRQYLKDGINVFGDALAAAPEDDEGAGAAEESKKFKKTRKSTKATLEAVTRKVRRAKKKGAATNTLLEVLAITLSRAEKDRKKLKKSIKGLSRKKAARTCGQLKEMDRRIKRAKKALKKPAR